MTVTKTMELKAVLSVKAVILAALFAPCVFLVACKPSASLGSAHGALVTSTTDASTLAANRTAAEKGDAVAQYNLGRMYAKGLGVARDDAQAVSWYRKAAEQGNARGQANLGEMYHEGRGVAKDDVQATFWFRKAAAQGNADAKKILAK